MGTRSRELVLLTDQFPYGTKSETFLEAEVEVLARRFDRVYVLPSHRKPGVRPLPDNCELVEMDWLEEPTRGMKWAALASPQAARVIAATRGGELRAMGGAPKLYLDNLARNVLKSRSLAQFVSECRLETAIFYAYWLEDSTLALALLRNSGAVRTAVARAHNFDIYDELWGGRPVPFQDFKGRALDAVFAVSADGADYLRRRVPALRRKVSVEYLGVADPGRVPAPEPSSEPVIVSCANLHPVKRIHLIPDVLNRLDRPLRWIHIGDGPERTRVERAARELGPHIRWELRGQLDNRDVLHFYESQPVTAFLSLSISEGLPVSIMEAQSHGIPVVACGVHGVPEIVNETTGVALPPSAGVAEITDAVGIALEPGRFDREAIRGFFATNFRATTNYNRFADVLIAFWQAQAAAA